MEYGRESSKILQNMQDTAAMERQGAADKAATSRGLIEAFIKGDIVEDPGTESFKSLEHVPGPGGEKGYVRAKDVLRSSPFTVQGKVTHGTKGDVMDANQQYVPGLVEEATEGDYEATKTAIMGIPDLNVRNTMLRQVEAMKTSGGYFSSADEKTIRTGTLSGQDLQAYGESIARIEQGKLADAARIATAKGEIVRNNLIRDDKYPGGLRPLNPAEQVAFALEYSGHHAELSKPQLDMIQRVYDTNAMVPRTTPPKIFEEVQSAFNGAANKGSQDNLSFINWLAASSMPNGDKGAPAANKLNELIRKTQAGVISSASIQAFSTSPDAAAYRAAYALYNGAATHTVSGIARLVNLNIPVPFDPKTAAEALADAFPSANDITMPFPAGYSDGDIDSTTGTDEEKTRGGIVSEYNENRQKIQKELAAVDPGILRAAAEQMKNGSPQAIADTLIATARDIRANGKKAGQEAQANALAAYYEDKARLARVRPGDFVIWRDSVFIPMVNGTLNTRK